MLQGPFHDLAPAFTPSEKGEFLALDLGDSCLTVQQVKVSEDRNRKVEMKSHTYPIPAVVIKGRGTDVSLWNQYCQRRMKDVMYF